MLLGLLIGLIVGLAVGRGIGYRRYGQFVDGPKRKG